MKFIDQFRKLKSYRDKGLWEKSLLKRWEGVTVLGFGSLALIPITLLFSDQIGINIGVFIGSLLSFFVGLLMNSKDSMAIDVGCAFDSLNRDIDRYDPISYLYDYVNREEIIDGIQLKINESCQVVSDKNKDHMWLIVSDNEKYVLKVRDEWHNDIRHSGK